MDSFYRLFIWAGHPVDSFIARVVVCFSRDTNPGRGDWCRSCGGWSCFWFWCSVSSNCESATLLVTRLGLMPCSAWSKKNRFEPNLVRVVRGFRVMLQRGHILRCYTSHTMIPVHLPPIRDDPPTSHLKSSIDRCVHISCGGSALKPYHRVEAPR